MYSNLHPLEISIYAFIWVAAVLYSVYQVYLTGNLYRHHSDSDDFSPGWWFIDRQKDISDYEWMSWLQFMQSVWPWVIVHLFGAELIRYWKHQFLSWWYVGISLVFLVSYVGPTATALLLSQPCLFYMILQVQSSAAVWMASAAVLIALNTDQTVDWLDLSDEKQYLFFVCFAWTHLRCLSFCFDQLMTEATCLLNTLSYVLYLPTLFLGPLILHHQFAAGLALPFKRWTVGRGLTLLANLGRFLGWLFFTEFALHFIYCNALQYHTEVIAVLGPWALCGLGYCMGQFFMNKYVVAYGLPGTIARAEQFFAPGHPKCIARIHLYSDMWKRFDPGLYSFLVKYIYVPLVTIKGHSVFLLRFFASITCFFFIYVWHRTYACILVWSVLNFVGVTLEALCKNLARTETYRRLENQLSPVTVRRCHALLASPLFVMSCVSNFYFFGGMDIGNIFMGRLCQVSSLNGVILFFCYCCCQVSIEVKNWEETRQIRKVSSS